MTSFKRYLSSLQGAFVQLERAGPEACQGWLVGVQEDYLTLRAPVGSDLHLPLHHIRSASRSTPLDPPPAETGTAPAPQTFAELLAQSVGRSVRLYHSGPEVTVGVLRECEGEHLVLEAATGEAVGFALFHVRSLYVPEDPQELLPLEPPEFPQGR